MKKAKVTSPIDTNLIDSLIKQYDDPMDICKRQFNYPLSIPSILIHTRQ
jgi:hypothetical protein